MITHRTLKNEQGRVFREIASVARGRFSTEARVGALSHDARVTFTRRYLYFRFRLALSLDQVRDLEAARIHADRAFEGPKPAWAT